MIRSFYYCNSDQPQLNLDPGQIRKALEKEDGLLWVSLDNPTSDEMQLILAEIFHFHPLAIEDCQSIGYQTPKVDDFGEYIFLIAHALHRERHLKDFDTKELNCFLGKNYLVTSYIDPEMSPVETVWKRLERDERLTHRGADFLLHAVLDTLVDEYLPLLDWMDEQIDLLQDQVLDRPNQQTLEDILELKHSTVVLRRITAPQREVMNRLSRDDFRQIDPQRRIYFRDIYDHLVRIQELSESIRDIVSDALGTYLSATSNRLNEIMKALTVVSTIFLPLSFVASLYGMNFHFMPELEWHYGYLMVWVVFILIITGMLTFFRRRGWF
jgi:magnesium transporter